MNGAQALFDTLVDAGVEVCFANPGTSEIHLVTAIGASDAVRAVLCLFEGVVSGAADGYARMAEKPAITLLHLGPGLANAMANLHNARRAHSPLVNIVGDHATYHLQYNAPLTSDVSAHAVINSEWVKISDSAVDLPLAGAEAVQAAGHGAGRIATLIVPANHAWEPAERAYDRLEPAARQTVQQSVVETVAKTLRNGKRSALVLGGGALREDALSAAGRVAEATGARLLCETFPARLQTWGRQGARRPYSLLRRASGRVPAGLQAARTRRRAAARSLFRLPRHAEPAGAG